MFREPSAVKAQIGPVARKRKQALISLKALSLGYAVPRKDFDATIHSVFESAINLQITNESNLLTLFAGKEGDLPQGIRVDPPSDFDFGAFLPGQQVTCRQETLLGGSLTVELHGAAIWKCDLPALRGDLTKPGVQGAWQEAWQALNKRQVLRGAEIVGEELMRPDETRPPSVLSRMSHGIRGLLEATRQYDLSSGPSVGSMIGLGGGLTPSGDDILVGYLAGLWSTTNDSRKRTRSVVHLAEAVIGLSNRTNAISSTYLYHAARGQVSSRLAALATVICAGEAADSILPVAESAMQVGHTSGMDAVTGLLLGLAAWTDPPMFCG